jgi:hypothetical protein
LTSKLAEKAAEKGGVTDSLNDYLERERQLEILRRELSDAR